MLGLNLYVAVFVASAVDATGLPVPGRLVLIAAGALSVGRASVVAVGPTVGKYAVERKLSLSWCPSSMPASTVCAKRPLRRSNVRSVWLNRFRRTVALL